MVASLELTTCASPVLLTAWAVVPWLQVQVPVASEVYVKTSEDKEEAIRCYLMPQRQEAEVNAGICKVLRWVKFSPAIKTRLQGMGTT